MDLEKYPRALLLLSMSTLAQADVVVEAPSMELEEVVVTAKPVAKDSNLSAAMTVLRDAELRLKVGNSIGDTLKNELGITSQSFGPGVGTPVIRGQSGARVKVLSNGLGSNDASQFSPDHASSVEPLLAESIEVLRGPAALQYSSGAIGGIVNVQDSRIPNKAFSQALSGALEQRFASVADETATVMKLEGSKQMLAYHLDGFYRDRNNLGIGGTAIDVADAEVNNSNLKVLQNTQGIINNSSAHAISGSAGVSLVGEPGFAGVAINRLENNYGIAADGSGKETTRIDLKQTKYDFKSELNRPINGVEKLSLRFGYNDYHHTELVNGQPGAFFSNQTFDSRVELNHKSLGILQGMLGIQATVGDFSAIDKGENTVIIPKSALNNVGAFAVEAFKLGAVAYQLSTRVESVSIAPQAMASLSYVPVSTAAAANWQLNGSDNIKLAITRSQRAPQVQELLSNGYHDATRSYERGNRNLHEETSYNLDLSFQHKSDGVQAELNLFHNWAVDYIYQQRNGQFVNAAPVLISAQKDATFMGYEAKLTKPLLDNHYGQVAVTMFSDFTRGQFVDGSNVPRMPPLRFGLQLEHDKNQWHSNLRLTRGEPQRLAGDFDTTTAGYVQLDLSSQYQVLNWHGSQLLFFAKANNLLNQNIRNSTSYLRNFAPEPGRGAEIGVRITY